VTIRLYNSLTRQEEDFRPLDEAKVRMYVCGPTVYDRAHIGNARPVVVFDVLFRLLRHIYGADHVVYARNITDVEDKIMKAAAENREPIEALTARYTEAYHQDVAALGALEPNLEPRATQHIEGMVAMIERLIASGHAYVADGHVLFAVSSFADYGALSGRDREAMIAGARVEVAPYKTDPADFVLWKPSSAEQPGWDSPWGRGRPGWHIECSVMAQQHLGESFDIHGGGIDLIFPHHENEIAQSRCAGPGHFARFWLHNGHVVVGGEKMSKSLGNFFTVRQLLDEGFPGEAIRLALLMAHYRAPLDLTRERVSEAKTQLDRLYGALRHGQAGAETPPDPGVLEALSEDLNVPLAISRLHELASALNKSESEAERRSLTASLLASGRLLGLLEQEPEAWFKRDEGEGEAAEIERLIQARNEARKARDFARADEIRDRLKAQGVLLEDGAAGTTWRRE
jgi:cysteinyl-tRNA synthetase